MSTEAPEGPDNPPGSAVSRPSKNNRHGGSKDTQTSDFELAPSDIDDELPGLRPISVEPNTTLRDEAVYVEMENGMRVPVTGGTSPDPEDTLLGRPTYRVLNEFREWYRGYESAHIEYESPEGETVRTRLENSYQPDYGKRYYAKLKDFERGITRSFDDVTTAMLTFTASHRNDSGGERCPADHMREIAEGWRNARKMVHKALSGRNWEYARIWEPHEDGYGHLHVAIFVEDAIAPEVFEPVMSSYVENVTAAGTEAHAVTGDDAAVSGATSRSTSVCSVSRSSIGPSRSRCFTP